MSDDAGVASAFTLEALAERLVRLEKQSRVREELAAENYRLRKRLEEVEQAPREARKRSSPTPVPPRTGDGDGDGDGEEVADGAHLVSRRGAFKVFGAAAAGGVGLALGSTLLGAEPAAAATGNMQYGETNDAGSAETALTGTVKSVALLNVENSETSQPGAGLYAMSYAPSGLSNEIGAIVADTNGKAGPAVVGMSSGGNAIYGIRSAKSGITAPPSCAVVGDTDGSGPGVLGLSGGGNGVHGVYNDTSGISSGMLAGIVGETDESAAGVLGLSAEASGVYGIASKRSGVSTDLNGGVVGDNGGLGPGVMGLGLILGIYGLVTGPSGLNELFAGVVGDSTTDTGVLGTSSGADGVRGVTSSAGASGVTGLDQASGDASHGVYGSSENGIGGQFQGGRAPLMLVPAGSPGAPTSGDHTQGEIYMDSYGVIFVCTYGSGKGLGTWQKLAYVG
jgi:hypothetical protein